MPRVISFIVLLAIILLVGLVFFQVMAQFIVPLFLAAVLVVMFQPLHAWVLRRLPERPRLSALVTTVLILLVVLLPLVWLGWNSYIECHRIYEQLPDKEKVKQLAAQFENRIPPHVFSTYERFAGKPLDLKALIEEFIKWAAGFVGAAVLSGVQATIGILVGLAILVISLYYYLADGPAMIRTLMRLSPLEDTYEQELLERFSDISRSVVVATLLSAVVQGAAAGVGYWFALPTSAPIFLLTALTMVLAIVPFFGAALMWVPICVWIYVFGEQVVDGQVVPQGNWVVALVLALYCGVIVSSMDNVIKPLVLHGQANLHPLLALLSILGGVQVLGPIGILVGPMLVSFLQALLNMLHKELAQFGKKEGQPAQLAAAAAPAALAATPEPPPSPAPKSSPPPAGKGKSGKNKD